MLDNPLEHDFKKFPELTNNQMEVLYFKSPHKQITENFIAQVVKVHDGDTITLRTDFRDFDFPLRIKDIDAPELKNPGGIEARNYLENLVLNQEVEVLINPGNRVEKWGRLLGDLFAQGVLVSEDLVRMGFAVPFRERRETLLPDIEKELNQEKWLTS